MGSARGFAAAAPLPRCGPLFLLVTSRSACSRELSADADVPSGRAAAAGGAGASAAGCAGVRSAAKLNCHLVLPVPVGARWGPDRSCYPRRAVLPPAGKRASGHVELSQPA